MLLLWIDMDCHRRPATWRAVFPCVFAVTRCSSDAYDPAAGPLSGVLKRRNRWQEDHCKLMHRSKRLRSRAFIQQALTRTTLSTRSTSVVLVVNGRWRHVRSEQHENAVCQPFVYLFAPHSTDECNWMPRSEVTNARVRSQAHTCTAATACVLIALWPWRHSWGCVRE